MLTVVWEYHLIHKAGCQRAKADLLARGAYKTWATWSRWRYILGNIWKATLYWCTDGKPGLPIGSVFIDRFIHQLMREKLEQIRQHLQFTPSEVAWKMISGRFQRLKCAFGTEATLTPWLKLDVPSLESDFDFPEADIYNGQMQIAWWLKLYFLSYEFSTKMYKGTSLKNLLISKLMKSSILWMGISDECMSNIPTSTLCVKSLI